MTSARGRSSALRSLAGRLGRGVAAVATGLAVLVGCTTAAVSDVSPTTAPPPGGFPSDSPLAIAPVGASEQAMTFDKQIRMLRIYRPTQPGHLAPLVVMLHGGLGTAKDAETAYGWDALAERDGFVVLYPQALDNNWNVGGGCCGLAASTGVDDVGFVKAAIDYTRAHVSIDPGRIYVTGMSSGGMLAYRLACDTTVFAAIGPVAATELGDCPNPGPVSVMHVHGSADPTVPYAGGQGEGIISISGPAIPKLHRTWSELDRCGGDVVQTSGAVTVATASCPNNRVVELVTIDGGGHDWPGVIHRGPLGASPSPAPSIPGAGVWPPPTVSAPVVGPTAATPTSAPTAAAAAYPTTEMLWAFFKTQAR